MGTLAAIADLATREAWKASSSLQPRPAVAAAHEAAAMAHRTAAKAARADGDRAAEDAHTSAADTHRKEAALVRRAHEGDPS